MKENYFNMSNYSATIVRINNLTKHPQADRLQITNIYGNSVIVGMETQIGDLGVYFPIESQLSEIYARGNDLIRRKDENGKMVGGFLEENRRVRAMKLRGIPSMGLFMPLESLDVIGGVTKPGDTPLDGFEFTEMNGHHICQKYTPRTNATAQGGKPKEGRKPRESKIIPNQFRFHSDTAQLGRNIHKINPSDTVVISWKMHGTSAIVSNCLVKKDQNLFARLLGKFLPIISTEYQYIYASRRVIKNEFAESKQHFYKTDLWSEIGSKHFGDKLHKGETIYYEIVGYTPDGSPIQGLFDYGCKPGEHKVYVYRITMTNADGVVTELQWNQVKERVREIGVETVPEIFYGKALHINSFDVTTMEGKGIMWADVKEHWNENLLQYLQMTYVYDQDSQFCTNKVPEEGICVRKEGLTIETFKLKSFRFLEGETKQLDKGEIDTETAES